MVFQYIYIVKIIAYFIVYSFIGWLIESLYKSFLQKKWIDSGFLNGPICPIYGIGALIMYLFLNNYKMNLILVFILGVIILSIWEFLVGIFLEKAFNTKYWDYSNNKFNIKGRICLFNSLCWGVLAVIFIAFLHPFISSKIDLIPQNILIIAVSILSAYIVGDTIQSVVKLKTLDKRLEKLKELNETIKEKLSELNNIKITTPDYSKNLQELVEKLQVQQDKLKCKVTKQTTKLKNAFPTMKSEKITEFLSQKIEEIREIKEKIKGE